MKRAVNLMSAKRGTKLILLALCLSLLMPIGSQAAYATIRPGDSGPQVVALQQALNALGYPVNADGKYGMQTVGAVATFQDRQRLTQDGIAGNQTLSVLYRLAPQYAPGPAQPVYPGYPVNPVYPTQAPVNERYELGSFGPAVSTLQTRLMALGYTPGRTDGVYDVGTRSAVVLFQQRNGLGADGIAGPQTLQRLYGASAVPAQGVVTAAPQFTPAPSTSDKYQLGDIATGVASLQSRLLALGYAPGRADGVFDAPTQTAVQSFQLRNGLSADGIAGALTLLKLYDTSAVPAQGAVTTAPQVTPVPSTGEKYQPGDHSTGVANLQVRLKDLGYNAQRTDGVYDNNTQAAVMVFQQKNGLATDGIAGPATLTRLYSPLAIPASGATPITATATPVPGFPGERYELGNTGTGVANLQVRLLALGYNPLRTDGVFDVNTRSAVIVFQQKNGLFADGIAGSLTLQRLYAVDAIPNTGFVTATPLPTHPPVLPPLDGSGKAKVTTGNSGGLYLRSAPTTGKNNVLATMPNGSVVTVLERGINWSRLRYGTTDGYAMSKFLTFDATPVVTLPPGATATPPPITPAEGTATVYTQNRGSLKFRSSPSALNDSNVIANLPFGTTVQVKVRGSDWTQVNYAGRDGWLMSRYLSFAPGQVVINPSPVPGVTATPAPSGPAVGTALVRPANGGSLRMRSSATSTQNNVIMNIPYCALVTVLSRGAEWTQVRYNAKDGYVMSSFLQFSSVQPVVTPAPVTAAPQPTAVPEGRAGTAVIKTPNGRSVNFRSSPELKSDQNLITTIKNGETVSVLSYGATWSSVQHGGKQGYIMSSMLSFTPAAVTAAPTAAPTPTASPQAAAPTQVPQNASIFPRTLRAGDQGEDVSLLQSRLSQLSYAVSETGSYDDSTLAAVRAFQRENGLNVDGAFGSNTAQALMSSNAKASPVKPPDYPSLRMGDKDDARGQVSQLQRALSALGYALSVDGSYGNKTHAAVVAFQTQNSLTISGIADDATQRSLYSGAAKPAPAATPKVDLTGAVSAGPKASEVKLLDWYSEVKPSIKGGQTAQVHDPKTGINFDLQYYSLGAHADSEPKSLRDTQLMNEAFGDASWDTRPVYVKLPSGDWTLATMHNNPHLFGNVKDNGFGGHLCVHFKRDLEETKKADPNYGMQNQLAIRSAWEKLTGQTVQ